MTFHDIGGGGSGGQKLVFYDDVINERPLEVDFGVPIRSLSSLYLPYENFFDFEFASGLFSFLTPNLFYPQRYELLECLPLRSRLNLFLFFIILSDFFWLYIKRRFFVIFDSWNILMPWKLQLFVSPLIGSIWVSISIISCLKWLFLTLILQSDFCHFWPLEFGITWRWELQKCSHMGSHLSLFLF